MNTSPSRIGDLVLPARREFLRDAGLGFGALALASLLGEESRASTTAGSSAARSLPHHPPRAKRVEDSPVNGTFATVVRSVSRGRAQAGR